MDPITSTEIPDPNQDSVVFQPSNVSWAVAEFIRKPPSLLALAFVYALISLVVIAVIYSYFSKVPISIATRGVLVTEVRPVPVRAPSSSRVKRILVTENQRVKKGDLLLVTENNILPDEYKQFRTAVTELASAVQLAQHNGCKKPCKEHLNSITRDWLQLDFPSELKDSASQVLSNLKDWQISLSQLETAEQLSVEDRRQLQVAERQITEIKRRKALRELAVEVEGLKAKIGTLKAEILNRRQSAESSLQQTYDRFDVKLKAFVDIVKTYMSSQELRAPFDGVVMDVGMSARGQVLGSGEELLKVLPLDTPLVAELQIQNKDIAGISMGLPVILKLDAFPARDYGAIRGKIIQVADVASQVQGALPAYRVVVNLDNQGVRKREVFYRFKYGMTLDAAIVVREERLLQLGIKKIFNLKDDVLGADG